MASFLGTPRQALAAMLFVDGKSNDELKYGVRKGWEIDIPGKRMRANAQSPWQELPYPRGMHTERIGFAVMAVDKANWEAKIAGKDGWKKLARYREDIMKWFGTKYLETFENDPVEDIEPKEAVQDNVIAESSNQRRMEIRTKKQTVPETKAATEKAAASQERTTSEKRNASEKKPAGERKPASERNIVSQKMTAPRQMASNTLNAVVRKHLPLKSVQQIEARLEKRAQSGGEVALPTKTTCSLNAQAPEFVMPAKKLNGAAKIFIPSDKGYTRSLSTMAATK